MISNLSFDKSYIDQVAPKHERISCSEDSPGFNALVKGDTNMRCLRCTLLKACQFAVNNLISQDQGNSTDQNDLDV